MHARKRPTTARFDVAHPGSPPRRHAHPTSRPGAPGGALRVSPPSDPFDPFDVLTDWPELEPVQLEDGGQLEPLEADQVHGLALDTSRLEAPDASNLANATERPQPLFHAVPQGAAPFGSHMQTSAHRPPPVEGGGPPGFKTLGAELPNLEGLPRSEVLAVLRSFLGGGV